MSHQFSPVNAAIMQGDSANVPSSVVERDASGDSAFRRLTSEGRTTSAGVFTAISTKTTNYTATDTDHTILVDATSGAVTITLPAAATSSGQELVVKKIDSSGNAAIIDGNASETIDGSTTKSFSTQYDSRHIKCNGTAWYILAQK